MGSVGKGGGAPRTGDRLALSAVAMTSWDSRMQRPVGDIRLQVEEASGSGPGRYRLGERLQVLPYATVHRALRVADRRPVLLWRFGERYSAAAGFLEALQSLAGDDRAIGVPGVAQVLEIGAVEGMRPVVYLVTEDAARGFLVTLLRSGGAPGVLATANTLATALDGLHQRGLVHGDLQPATVAVDGAGRALLVSRAVRMVVARVDPSAGWLELTRGFRPPESRQPLWPDRSTDIYGLAALTYYLLVGRAPEQTGEVVPPSRLRPDLPPRIDQALLRALAREPSSRFGSAREFASALRERPAPRPSPAGSAQRPAAAAAGDRGQEVPTEPGADGQPPGTGLISLTHLDPFELDSRARRRSGLLMLLGMVAVALVLVVLSATGRISP